MLMVLVATVILLFAAVALVYSTDTSLFGAGNLGFQRDLQNQSSRAIAAAAQEFATGNLSNPTTLLADSPANNYSSTVLAVDGTPGSTTNPSHGIPAILLDPAGFALKYPNGTINDSVNKITLRYVIDRMCNVAGVPDKATCMIASTVSDKGGTAWLPKAGATIKPVYRVSVLAQGPRNTQAFVQTTLTY